MDGLRRDIRYAARTLSAKPGWTAIVVLTLAVGIAASTSIFSIVNGVLLTPLQFPQSDRLVKVWEKRMALGRTRNVVSPADFMDWREQNTVFSDMGAYAGAGYNLTGVGEPERVNAVGATPGLFSTLGVQALVGRTFTPEEEEPGHSRVALIGYGLWVRRFAASPEIVGQTIELDDQSVEVVGVMPAQFQFPTRSIELWVPIVLGPEAREIRGSHSLEVIARLKNGVTVEQARSEMDAIAARLEEKFQVNTGHGANVFPLHEEVVGSTRPALLILLCAVGLLLLIACANVANLQLSRAIGRSAEITIRSALGANRCHIIRQLLTESLILGLTGGSLGLLISLWSVDLLTRAGGEAIPRVNHVGIDSRVLLVGVAVSLLTGVLSGLAPALQISKPNLQEALKTTGGWGAKTGGSRLRNVFVVAQIALALLMLIGSGLMIKSFNRLLRESPGFNPEGILTFNIALPRARYSDETKAAGFYRDIVKGISEVHGVVSVGAVTALPFAGGFGSRYFSIEGHPPKPAGQGDNANINSATPDYFRTLGIPLIRGREFNADDVLGKPEVVIVNEEAARRFWPDEDPIGTRVRVGDQTWRVVGIVAGVKQASLDVDARPEIYFPYSQQPWRWATLAVRTDGNVEGLIDAIGESVRSVDRQLPVFDVKTMNQVIDESVSSRRFSTILLAIFAALAFGLATVGVYSVISYSVERRVHEIGIRMALGAQGRDVLRLVLKSGAALAVTGIGVGLIAAFALTRLMSSILFGVGATDPSTFGSLSFLLLIVALLACYIPARRATRIDPMVALRIE